MREWTVWNKEKTGIVMTFPDWHEPEARAWMKEHEKYINMPGSPLEGAILELREFETKDERIRRAAREVIEAHAANVAAGIAQIFGQAGPDPLETSDQLSKAIDVLDSLTK